MDPTKWPGTEPEAAPPETNQGPLFQPGDKVLLNGQIQAVVLRCTHNALSLRFVGELGHVPAKPA